jgi:hypothetical protein
MIAVNIVTVAGMTTADQDAVGPTPEGVEDKSRINPTRAHDSDTHHIGGILHSGGSGQISAGITAPVA